MLLDCQWCVVIHHTENKANKWMESTQLIKRVVRNPFPSAISNLLFISEIAFDIGALAYVRDHWRITYLILDTEVVNIY
jgi:hypothetical protein